MTSNQSSSPLCAKCMEEKRRSRGLCCQVQTEERICFCQPKSSKEVGFKHNATMFQKINQCIYVASIWTNSLRMEPLPHLPTSFDWTLDEDKTYCIKWFEGNVAPKIVKVVKDDSCTGYGEFSNSKIQRHPLQNNSDTNFDNSAFFLISSHQKLFFNFL